MTARGLHAAFLSASTSSFAEFLAMLPSTLVPQAGSARELADLTPHGTTIVALRGPYGAVIAGDRRATVGSFIAQRDIEKVFATDEHSVVGIAGTAGIAVELVRLFQVELEHYEKIEGTPLSLDGKANRLATLLRGNLGLAMQGLVVVPLFAGFDLAEDRGRIFSYDPTGGRYEEHDFYAVGSGAFFARGSLKKLYRPDAEVDSAIATALASLYDAAEEDSATGGPDLARRIFPIVAVVTGDGVRFLPEDDVQVRVEALVAQRMADPNGGAL
mgnify:FL=1